MNTKIFALIKKNLDTSFSLPKYENVRNNIGHNTMVEDLPWTPARYRKFKDAVESELGLPCEYRGTLKEIINDLSERYTKRFFAEIWKPRTGEYDHSGWALAETIAKQDPKNVLDVGCGYHRSGFNQLQQQRRNRTAICSLCDLVGTRWQILSASQSWYTAQDRSLCGHISLDF